MSKISELIQKGNVEEIALQFTDISGVLHSVWVPSELFLKVTEEGIHIDGSSVDMVDISKSDLKLIPDLDTFVILPSNLFAYRVARVICDIYHPESNRHFELDPRFVLKKVIDSAKKSLGASVQYYASAEMEYFLFERQEDGKINFLDEAGYLATPPTDRGADLRLEITKKLQKHGFFD